jgi:hypothetical protein
MTMQTSKHPVQYTPAFKFPHFDDVVVKQEAPSKTIH